MTGITPELVRGMPHSPSYDDRSMADIAEQLNEDAHLIEQAAARYLRNPFVVPNPELGALIMQSAAELAAGYSIFDGKLQVAHSENYWVQNLLWLGEQLEMLRIKRFWSETHPGTSAESLKIPEETMVLFARAVYLRGVAADMLDENPDRTVELEQLRAMLSSIHSWLDETEGQDWDWRDQTSSLIRDGVRI